MWVGDLVCGIVGYIDRYNPVDGDVVREMSSMIAHRGPDDEGYYCVDRVALGMKRLSIIDLFGGKQPILNEDGSIVLIFNGEIYNYQELTEDLAKRGHKFRTKTDSEVIVHQYEESGTDCVAELNGMFAFALWNGGKRTLYLARDRMGIKPLYYVFDDRHFRFASEIKALGSGGFFSDTRLNERAIWDYLTFRYVPEPETIWLGIKKLEPGHWIELDTVKWTMRVVRYWEITYEPDRKDTGKKIENEYLEEFSWLFEDSVRRHLQADVPVGVLLSGGLDSSAVLSAIKRIHGETVYSFSVGFEEGGEFNELNYARKVAKHVGAINHEIVIGHKEFIDYLPQFVWYTDEPLADLASVPLYYVSRLAAEHVKVVLSGEGSDEVFGGYDLEKHFERFEKFRRYRVFPRWFRKHMLKPLLGSSAEIGYYDAPRNELFHMTNVFSEDEKKLLFSKEVDFAHSMTLVKNYYDKVKKVHPINQVLFVFSQSWLVEDLLMKADKMTMANSIELRVPFLDYRLVEWAARAPVSLKIGTMNGEVVTKRILRIYCQDKIPQSIIQREKRGFPVPAYRWLSEELKDFVMDVLGPQSYVSAIFQKGVLAEIISRGTEGDAVLMDRHRLWSILVLELWFKRWLQG
jgi:asparagine synthase (glutamine-hydrolysing)